MQSINQPQIDSNQGNGEVFMPALRRGNFGLPVRILQRFLFDRGYRLTNDGIFGKQTEEFIKDFQTKSRLLADGIVGVKTWEALTGFEPDV
ncbi:MAG: peptidoglycan-binding protein [Heteroscytonema crispum UTEX LB 1556]